MLTSPRFWLAIAAAAVVLGLVGPFGTYDGLRLPARLAYWAATVFSTYVVGVALVALMARLYRPGGAAGAGAYALFGAAAGVPVTLVVWGLNAAVFEGGAMPFMPLLGYTVAIAAVVSAVIAVFSAPPAAGVQGAPLAAPSAATPAAPLAAAPDVQPAAAPRRPRILDRLPPHLRGELSHITVQDHYVDIRTDRGGALVLMRLADAIAETEGVPGLRIHRSHWVAAAQVARSVRRDGRLVLVMKDGTALPVSRSFLPDVRAAGLG